MFSEIVSFDFDKKKVLLPIKHNLNPVKPKYEGQSVYNYPIHFSKVERELIMFSSKDAPYLITVKADDCKQYKFILKFDQTDFRLESKFMDYAN